MVTSRGAMNSGVVLARPARSVGGEAERICHVFPMPLGAVPADITALCGESFGPSEVERLDGPAGMPCEACLWRVGESLSGQLPPSATLDEAEVRRRLDAIERTLDELERQVEGVRVAVAAILDEGRRGGMEPS